MPKQNIANSRWHATLIGNTGSSQAKWARSKVAAPGKMFDDLFWILADCSWSQS